MAESKGGDEHLQYDGEIPGKLREEPIDKDATQKSCDLVQSDEKEPAKIEDLDDDLKKKCIVCDPCEEDGKSLKAEGYCVDCNDFLCFDCFRIHRKPKLWRLHVLQNKDSMPHTKFTTSKEKQNERHCLTHHRQTLISYCSTHDSVLCELCQQFDHRQCQKKENVNDLNGIVLDTDQLADVQCQIAALKEELENNKTIATQTGENIESSYARVVKEITKMKDSDLQMTKDISSTCENMLLELVSIGEDLKSLSATEDTLQLFLKLKKAQTFVKTFKGKLKQVGIDNKNFEYMLIETEKKDETFGKMGTLLKCPIELEGINIKTEEDAKNCFITGIAMLSENKYVIADYNNKKVYLIDVSSKTVTLDFKLDMTPCDITKVGENKMAVTTFDAKKIIFISISDTITVENTLDTSDHRTCKGIVFGNDNLIVSHGTRNEIQMLTLDGKIKHTVRDTDIDGNVRFGDVRFISIGDDLNILYLADGTSNKVLRMTLDGEVLGSFTHEYLKSPRGITCSRDGSIFVCSLHFHMIFEISSDLSQGKVILGKESGIFKPCSIFFSEEKQQLLVGSIGKNSVQVFQL